MFLDSITATEYPDAQAAAQAVRQLRAQGVHAWREPVSEAWEEDIYEPFKARASMMRRVCIQQLTLIEEPERCQKRP